MKRFLSVLRVLVFLIGVGGCRPSAMERQQPAVVMRVLDPSLEQFSTMWQAEVSRRFSNAVVILVHGGDFVEGQWIVGDWNYRSEPHVRRIEDVIREAAVAQPGRTIVVLACNPGHITLHHLVNLDVPVFYAKSSVWCVPDRDTATVPPVIARMRLIFGLKARAAEKQMLDAGRWSEDPDVTGNIFEFIQAD